MVDTPNLSTLPKTDEIGRRMLPRKFDSLSFEVEVSPGTPIALACQDLVSFSDFMGMVITAKFNGVTLMAHPGGVPEWLAANWETELNSKRTHPIAVSYVLRPSKPKAETDSPSVITTSPASSNA